MAKMFMDIFIMVVYFSVSSKTNKQQKKSDFEQETQNLASQH